MSIEPFAENSAGLAERFVRFAAVLKKEWTQMRRDPSIFLVAWALPVFLILLFGAGLSMDLNRVPTAVVDLENSALSHEIAARFLGSPYFDAGVFRTRQAAESALAAHDVDLIVDLPDSLTRDAQRGRAQIGVTINGVDASAAMVARTYAAAALTQGAAPTSARLAAAAQTAFVRSADRLAQATDDLESALSSSTAQPIAPAGGTVFGRSAAASSPSMPSASKRSAESSESAASVDSTALSLSADSSAKQQLPGAITLISRAWFNDANNSAWYLVPGLSVVILTLTCSFMGSLVIAREWERGTMEALSATPVGSAELVAAKFLLNFALASVGLIFVFLIAKFVFEVPVRGSVGLLIATALIYNAWAMSFGLLLSALTKSQFVSIQLSVIFTYLPALILSGFLFDLRSVPAWIAAAAHLMPATYAVESVKILCLSGGATDLVLRNLAVLCAAFAVFMTLGIALTKKRLD